MKNEINKIISQLKKHELNLYAIPEEYTSEQEIIEAERKLGFRHIEKCGFDVINNNFFVVEKTGENEFVWVSTEIKTFEDFNTYFSYLNGNIYNNSCYYQLDPKRLPESIDKDRIYRRKAFIDTTINDFTLYLSEEEQARYNSTEENKSLIKKWISKFNECTTFEQLCEITKRYDKSPLKHTIDVSFFFWNYIFADTNSKNRFDVIMQYMSSGVYPQRVISRALCTIYDPDTVVENFKFELGTYQTRRKHILDLKKVAEKVKNNEYVYKRRTYVDQYTNYFCIETKGFEDSVTWPAFSYKEYFETIEGLVDRLSGNLKDCDLSKAQNIHYDFKNCIIDDTTILPIDNRAKYDYTIKKSYIGEKYYVIQEWKSENGSIVKRNEQQFDYFCDFVAFLNGDLSNADLISCDGLENLNNIEGLNLKAALLTSSICRKFNIPYDIKKIEAPEVTSFTLTELNEIESSEQVHISNEIATKDLSLLTSQNKPAPGDFRVYYISDIHFYHLLANYNALTETDIIHVVREVANTINKESEEYRFILINGDTSLDFYIFELFVQELRRILSPRKNVIFTIGNHDLWSCPDKTLEEIVETYKKFLASNGMFLLQNDILFLDEYGELQHISEDILQIINSEDLRLKTRTARLIFFGGIGFAGYNEDFNARNGLYRYNNTIGYNREFEIKETQKFEALYKKICSAFHGKNVIIMTHMPLHDWLKTPVNQNPDIFIRFYQEKSENSRFESEPYSGSYSAYQPGFYYISGHTHKNYMYDDGEIHIYSDNQFGYNQKKPSAKPHLKYFDIDGKFDYFSDFDDGVYEISADDYKTFYRGKKIHITFERAVNIIYMLKRNGYYCFIHKSKNDKLSILNGGTLKGLPRKDIQYYYNNMEQVIALLENPLQKYTKFQTKVANEIKKIGGYGFIHGCIVDIDFFNHIYVNPLDSTLTGYWARDIIDKTVYPNIPALLETQCPRLFLSYKKLLKSDSKNSLLISAGETKSELSLKPIPYLDTDIYRASRQLRKMQKLHSNILSIWPDDLPIHKMLKSELDS